MAIEGVLFTAGTLSQPRPNPLGVAERVPPAFGSDTARLERDPVSLRRAAVLTGEIAAINGGRANARNAAAVLQAADAGYAAIDERLADLKELATDASSSTASAAERAHYDAEFRRLLDEITDIAQTTRFGGRDLLVGGASPDTLDFAFRVGDGTDPDADTVTVSLAAATVDQLSSDLPTASLQGENAAASALTAVTNAIASLDDARASVRADNVRIAAAVSSADDRGAAAEAERAERLATRIRVDLIGAVADETLKKTGTSDVLHATDVLRDLLTTLQNTVVPATIPESRQPAQEARQPTTGSRDTAERDSNATADANS